MTFLSHKNQNLFIRLPIAGMIVFVVFYVLAALRYSGGSYAFPNQMGFDLKDNYLCDLLDTETINGLQNTARTYARMALAILCMSLMVFWFYLPKLFTVKTSSQAVMSISGILSMVITLFLATEVHDVIIRIAGFFGAIALVLAIFELYKDHYFMLFFLGIVCLILFLTNYYIYETELLLYTLPLLQKFTFIFCIIWFMLMNRALYKKRRRVYE